MINQEKLQRIHKLYEKAGFPLEDFDSGPVKFARSILGNCLLSAENAVSLERDYVEIGCGRNPALTSAAGLAGMNKPPRYTLIEPRFGINYETAADAKKKVQEASRYKAPIQLIPDVLDGTLPANIKSGATLVMFNVVNYVDPAVLTTCIADPRIKAVAIANGDYGYTEDKAAGYYSFPDLRQMMWDQGFWEYIHIISLGSEAYLDANYFVGMDFRDVQQFTMEHDTPQFMVWLKPDGKEEAKSIQRTQSIYGLLDFIELPKKPFLQKADFGKLLYGHPQGFLSRSFRTDTDTAEI